MAVIPWMIRSSFFVSNTISKGSDWTLELLIMMATLKFNGYCDATTTFRISIQISNKNLAPHRVICRVFTPVSAVFILSQISIDSFIFHCLFEYANN